LWASTKGKDRAGENTSHIHFLGCDMEFCIEQWIEEGLERCGAVGWAFDGRNYGGVRGMS